MSKCGGTFKENNRCYFPGASHFISAAFSQNLKRWQRILKATQGIRCCEFQPSAPPESHTLIKSVCSRQCLQIFLLRLASTHISPIPLLVSESGSQSQRSNREDVKNWQQTERDPFDQGSSVTPHSPIYSGLPDTQDPLPHFLYGPLLVWQADARFDFSHGYYAKKYP